MQGYPAVATPPADFAARLSGLAEDMPRLQRDALMQESSQVCFCLSHCCNASLVCSDPARHMQVRAQLLAIERPCCGCNAGDEAGFCCAFPAASNGRASPKPSYAAGKPSVPRSQPEPHGGCRIGLLLPCLHVSSICPQCISSRQVQGVAEPPAMPVQGTPAMSATTVAPVVLPMAAQRIPSSVGG